MNDTDGNHKSDAGGGVALADAASGETLARILERVESIGRSIDRLEGLLERAPQLEALARKLDAAPGLLGILIDAFDEWAAGLAAQGIDLETAARQGLHAALWLGQRIRESELNRLGILLGSDVLEPHALAVAGKAGRALAACHESACATEGPERLGILGMIRALGDPDIQRTLAFAARAARRFGGHLCEPAGVPARNETPSNHP